jgi:hypothetical protein
MAPEPGWPALDLFFASHPWHGVAIGPDAPRQVTVYVEIVPSDTVQYEVDKDSGEVIRRSQEGYLRRFGETLGPVLARE